jgi:hypothetical protein
MSNVVGRFSGSLPLLTLAVGMGYRSVSKAGESLQSSLTITVGVRTGDGGGWIYLHSCSCASSASGSTHLNGYRVL